MKRLFAIFVAAVVAATCSDDKPLYLSSENSNAELQPTLTGVGYFSFSDEFKLVVDSTTEEFVGKSSDSSLDNYQITIKNTKTDVVLNGFPISYGDISDLEDMIEVDAGYYSVSATSYGSEGYDDVQWSEPVYSGYIDDIVLSDDKVFTVEELPCYQENIGINVVIDAYLKSLFKSDEQLASGDETFNVKVSVRDHASITADFDYDEDRTVYFAKQGEESMTLDIELSGCYMATSDSYVNITSSSPWRAEIEGVDVGQLRNVTIRFDNYTDGNLNITFEVEEWVEENILGVSILSKSFYAALNDDSFLGEESIYDPDKQVTMADSPVLSFSGLELEEGNFIFDVAEMIDYDAESYYPSCKATLTPTLDSSVAKVSVLATDLSEELAALFDENGEIVLYDAESSVVSDYFTVSGGGVDNPVVVTLKYKGAVELSKYSGVQSFTIYAIDDKSRTSYTSLDIEVVTAANIEWVEGYSFDEVHTIYEYDSMNIGMTFNITADSGIASLMVAIYSEVLDADELGGLGLAQEMDLVNPATDAMAEALGGENGLGFPVRDEVEGQTAVLLDITSFMSMLGSISKTGDTTDFVITVVDQNGGSCQKTLMVVVDRDVTAPVE